MHCKVKYSITPPSPPPLPLLSPLRTSHPYPHPLQGSMPILLLLFSHMLPPFGYHVHTTQTRPPTQNHLTGQPPILHMHGDPDDMGK